MPGHSGSAGLEALLDSTLEAVQDEWWGEGEARNNGEGGRAPESEKGQAGIPAFLYRTCLATAAYRVLVAGPPPEVCRPLSSLRLGPREALVRVLVVGHTGEEVVLVWRMRLEDSLEPVYKGLRVRERWAVVSVAGEPAGEPEDQRPDEPAPEVPPEAVVQVPPPSLQSECSCFLVFLFSFPVSFPACPTPISSAPLRSFPHIPGSPLNRPVAALMAAPSTLHDCPTFVPQAQLESLRDLNIQRCYNFASPSNRAAFKDDLAHFGSMLRTPAYQVLLGHASSEILETKQVSTSTFIAVCGINSNQGRAVFIWVCTLQPPGSALLPNCWLTDAVYRADSAAPVGRPADPT